MRIQGEAIHADDTTAHIVRSRFVAAVVDGVGCDGEVLCLYQAVVGVVDVCGTHIGGAIGHQLSARVGQCIRICAQLCLRIDLPLTVVQLLDG